MKNTRWLACGLLLLGAACSGTSSSNAPSRGGATAEASQGATSSGGSLWDQLDRDRKTKAERIKLAEARTAGASTLPAGWKEKIDRWWQYYVQGDPSWPDARKEWLALGGDAPQILAENLLRAYVFAWDQGSRVEVNRARLELIDLKRWSLPILLTGLGQGFGDSVVRNLSTDLVAEFGDDAVPAIEKAWDSANAKGRWELARALRKVKRPSAVALLSRIATSDESFEPRIEALQGLGEIADPAGYAAVLRCIGDRDPSVRKFAAHYIAAFKRRDAVPALVDCLATAQEERQSETASEATKSLVLLTGRRIPADAAQWRAYLASPEWRAGAAK